MSLIIKPWMDQFELKIVHPFLVELKNKNCYLEIGSRDGGSLRHFSQYIRVGGKLVAVDLKGGSFKGAEENLKSVVEDLQKTHEVSLILGDSTEPKTIQQVKNECQDGIDLLLIDGDHSLYGVASDVRTYMKMVKGSGIVLIHDCGCLGGSKHPQNAMSVRMMRNCAAAFEEASYGLCSLVVREGSGLGLIWKK